MAAMKITITTTTNTTIKTKIRINRRKHSKYALGQNTYGEDYYRDNDDEYYHDDDEETQTKIDVVSRIYKCYVANLILHR